MSLHPLRFASLAAILALSACSEGTHDDHDHDHDHDHADAPHRESGHDHRHGDDPGHRPEGQVGPNGGRVVTATDPRFEFLVLDDRRLKITFLSDAGEAIAPGAATVTAVGGERSQPTTFAFAEAGGALVSDAALPEGDMVPIVLQVKLAPDADTVTEKFTINLKDCPTCDYKEYACICDHDHDHAEEKKKEG